MITTGDAVIDWFLGMVIGLTIVWTLGAIFYK